jgi:hypothetical protein
MGEQLAVTNAAAFFPAVLVLTWRYRHIPWVGVGVGLIAAIKLAPIGMTGWMIGGRRWRMLTVTVATVIGVGLLGGIGAGFHTYFDYLDLIPTFKPSPDSLASLTGLPWINYAMLATGMVLAASIGGRWPRLTFCVAVIACVAGTPVIYQSGLVTLLALGAPLVPDRVSAAESLKGAPSPSAQPASQPG